MSFRTPIISCRSDREQTVFGRRGEIAYWILRLELEPEFDGLARLPDTVEPDQSLGLAEVALGPGLLQLDDDVGVGERADEVAGFKVGG